MRFYSELSEWWLLFPLATHYLEEAEDPLRRLAPLPPPGSATLLRPGGTVIVRPDYVQDTFDPGIDHGGEEGDDGRGCRYLERRWDPDPSDTTYIVDFAFLLHEALDPWERDVFVARPK